MLIIGNSETCRWVRRTHFISAREREMNVSRKVLRSGHLKSMLLPMAYLQEVFLNFFEQFSNWWSRKDYKRDFEEVKKRRKNSLRM